MEGRDHDIIDDWNPTEEKRKLPRVTFPISLLPVEKLTSAQAKFQKTISHKIIRVRENAFFGVTMNRYIQTVALTLLASPLLLAQSTPAHNLTPSSGPVLEDGTPVKIRIARTVSSADAHVGDTVDFEVLEEVRVGTLLLIPKGGVAWGTITQAEAKRRMARGGKLDMNIDSVRLTDGEKVALRAVKEVKGGGHTGAMTGAIVGTAIVFFPAAPLFLFMHLLFQKIVEWPPKIPPKAAEGYTPPADI